MVVGLEEEPRGLAALRAARAYQVPASLQLFAVQLEVEVPLGELPGGLTRRYRIVGAAVPDEGVAAAILAVGDAAFEAAVFERMGLGLDFQALDRWVIAWTLGNGPGGEHTIDLQPQVVVQPGGVVFMD